MVRAFFTCNQSSVLSSGIGELVLSAPHIRKDLPFRQDTQLPALLKPETHNQNSYLLLDIVFHQRLTEVSPAGAGLRSCFGHEYQR